MRLVIAASASCLLLASLGCGLELTKEEGARRSPSGGIGGVGVTDLSTPASPGPSTTPESTPPVEPAPAQTEQPPAATPVETPPREQPPAPASAPAANTAAAEDAVTVGARSLDPNNKVMAAKRGVGKTGRFETPGYTFVVLRSYFLTKQRIELEMKVPQALNLYKAEHGNFPKTVEDFNRDVIEFNQIKLPELPQGHRYVYDPEDGLLVEVPKK